MEIKKEDMMKIQKVVKENEKEMEIKGKRKIEQVKDAEYVEMKENT